MKEITQIASHKILNIIDTEWAFLSNLSEQTVSATPGENKWSIKQILGHLIDSASNNHQRMVRLQYQQHLIFPDYTADNETWVAVQAYQQESWNSLVTLWKYYNLHIAHLIMNIDANCLLHEWPNSKGNTVTLAMMLTGYSEHLSMHMQDIHAIAANFIRR